MVIKYCKYFSVLYQIEQHVKQSTKAGHVKATHMDHWRSICNQSFGCFNCFAIVLYDVQYDDDDA